METVRPILAIAFVLALLGAALLALRQGTSPLRVLRSGRQPERGFKVIERIALTPQHSLHIVRAGAEEWILATHPQGCSVIQKSEPAATA